MALAGWDNKQMLSHSLWVRGLKYDKPETYVAEGLSHSLWVRGLK